MPFLAALPALFGRVQKQAGKPPKSNKTSQIARQKKEAKTGKKRRSTDKQDKGLASKLNRQAANIARQRRSLEFRVWHQKAVSGLVFEHKRTNVLMPTNQKTAQPCGFKQTNFTSNIMSCKGDGNLRKKMK